MANNSRSLRRGKQKLEPISIDELAGDSTMTGFSDLFKIPTAVGQAVSINSSVSGGSETAPPETATGVGAGIVDRQRAETIPFPASVQYLNDDETGGPVTGAPV